MTFYLDPEKRFSCLKDEFKYNLTEENIIEISRMYFEEMNEMGGKQNRIRTDIHISSHYRISSWARGISPVDDPSLTRLLDLVLLNFSKSHEFELGLHIGGMDTHSGYRIDSSYQSYFPGPFLAAGIVFIFSPSLIGLLTGGVISLFSMEHILCVRVKEENLEKDLVKEILSKVRETNKGIQKK